MTIARGLQGRVGGIASRAALRSGLWESVLRTGRTKGVGEATRKTA
jgi:hypothetical protein